MTFVQDLAADLGMEWENTGGGCMALVRRLDDGSAIVITDTDDNYSRPDWDSDRDVVGAYVQHDRNWDSEDGYEVDPVLIYASAHDSELPWSEEEDGPVRDLPAERVAVVTAVRAYLAGLGL